MILMEKLQSTLAPYKQVSLDLFDNELELILRFISICSRASEGFNIKEENFGSHRYEKDREIWSGNICQS